MGTGTYAKQCMRYFENVTVEGVEIDQKITDLAGTYFALPDSVQVTTYDGRAYLQAVDQKYDVIMVDAYQDITIPFQMSSVEFFTLVEEHLKEDGVMVVNMNMKSGDAAAKESINAYLADTIATVFDSVYTVDVTGSTNRELFAARDGVLPELLAARAGQAADPELGGLMESVSDSLTAYEPGNRILTDDKAPVELLGMRVIDELIRDEIGIYRDIFKERGIEGLLGVM